MVRRFDITEDGVGRSDDCECTVTYLGESPAAYKVADAGNEVWLPKSQCIMQRNPGNITCTVTVPGWLAKAKGLV